MGHTVCFTLAAVVVCLGQASNTGVLSTSKLTNAWLAGAADGAEAGAAPLSADWHGRFDAARSAVGAALTTLRSENASVLQSAAEQQLWLQTLASVSRIWQSPGVDNVDSSVRMSDQQVHGLVVVPPVYTGADWPAFSSWLSSAPRPLHPSTSSVGRISVRLGPGAPCVADLFAVAGSSRRAAVYRLPLECLRAAAAASSSDSVDMRIAVHLRSRQSSGGSFNAAETMQVAALPSRVRVPSIADLLGAASASAGLPPVMVTATSVCGTTSVGAGAGAAGVGAEAWGSFGGAGLADFHFVRLMQARQGFSSASEAADLQLPMATETEAQALLHAASRAAADSAAVSSSGLLGWARWLLACLSHSLSHFPDAVMRWQAQAQTSADVAAAPAGSTAAPRPWAHFLPPLLQQQAPAQRDQIDGGGGSWGWPYAEPSIASWIAARQPVSHVLSGAGGRFCFHGVPAGAYHLMLAPGHAEVQSLGLAPAPLALAVSIGSSDTDGSEDTLALAPLVGVPLTLQRPTVAGQLTIAASSSSSSSGSAARTDQEELALLLALSPTGSAADWATAVAPVRVPVAAGCRVAVLLLPAAQSLQALAREGAAAVPFPVAVHGAWHGAFSVHARLVAVRTLANASSSTSASRSYPLPASMPCSDLLPLLPSARTSGAAAAAAAATEPAELEAQLGAAGFVSTRGGSAAMHLPVAVHVTGADFGIADAAALVAALSADVDAVKSEAAAASAAAAAAASAKSKAATGSRAEPLQLLAPLTAALSRLTVNSAATLLVLLLTSAALCFPAQASAAAAWAKQLVGLQQRSVMSEGPHGSRSIPQRRNKVASKATR